jgi:PPP family 3-phenylpropionic acid transporter
VGLGPVVDALTVSSSPEGYGRVRMWGSFGFLVAAAAGGVALTLRGSRPADPLVPLLMVVGLLLAAVVAFRIEASPTRPRGRPHLREIGALLRDRRFRLLLATGTLHWMNLAPYNGFFGLFWRGRHLSPAVGGAAFVAGVLAEGGVLFWFARLRAHFRLETLLAISFGATAVRWLLVWSATSAFALVALQTVHGLTFGLFWISGIALLNDCVPRSLRATGQALYLMAIFGGGSLAGYHATGLALDTWNDVRPAFLCAGLLELLPFGMMLAVARRPAPLGPRFARGP